MQTRTTWNETEQNIATQSEIQDRTKQHNAEQHITTHNKIQRTRINSNKTEQHITK